MIIGWIYTKKTSLLKLSYTVCVTIPVTTLHITVSFKTRCSVFLVLSFLFYY